MSTPQPPPLFGKDDASSFDAQRAKLAPIRDALHLLTGLVLSELPVDARILCVGAGTGEELLALAERFPQWRFTAVDPAGPMLAVCRQRAEAAGIAARCTFHEGYLDTVPESDPFDAATSFLVSHFLQVEQRKAFFKEIARRLAPGGILLSADIASDLSSTKHERLLEVWTRMLRYSGMPDKKVEQLRSAFGRDLSVLPAAQVQTLIGSSGFDTPVLFFQTLLIHGWYATRAA